MLLIGNYAYKNNWKRVELYKKEGNLSNLREESFEKMAKREPTQVVKIGGRAFLVDYGRGEVLTKKGGSGGEWRKCLGGLKKPHSIAGNEKWLVVDESEAGQVRAIRVEEWFGQKSAQNEQINEQAIAMPGLCPHRCRYDQRRGKWWVLMAKSWEMAILGEKADRSGLEIVQKLKLEFLRPFYRRSFSFSPNGDEIWWVAGSDDLSEQERPIYRPEKGRIWKARIEWSEEVARKEKVGLPEGTKAGLPEKVKAGLSKIARETGVKWSEEAARKAGVGSEIKLSEIESWSVEPELANMNDLGWFDGRMAITTTGGGMWELSEERGKMVKKRDLGAEFMIRGTPYYFEEENGRIIVPEIGERSGVGRYWLKRELEN